MVAWNRNITIRNRHAIPGPSIEGLPVTSLSSQEVDGVRKEKERLTAGLPVI